MLPYQAKRKLQEIALRMKKIKGKKMNDFDFDDLLDEVDKDAADAEKVEAEAAKVDLNLDALLNETSKEVINAPAELEISPPVPVTKIIENSKIEYIVETDAYVQGKLALDAELKALKQEQKDLQDEFSDQGVDVKSANKALAEMKKEIKETPEEAKLINDLKNRYLKDERIFASIEALIN